MKYKHIQYKIIAISLALAAIFSNGCASRHVFQYPYPIIDSTSCRPIDVTATSDISPEYPSKELSDGIEATVQVQVIIDEFGIIQNIEIQKSGGPTFDEAAVTALKKAKFSPMFIDCKPVKSKFNKKFNFKLQSKTHLTT